MRIIISIGTISLTLRTFTSVMEQILITTSIHSTLSTYLSREKRPCHSDMSAEYFHISLPNIPHNINIAQQEIDIILRVEGIPRRFQRHPIRVQSQVHGGTRDRHSFLIFESHFSVQTLHREHPHAFLLKHH